MSSRPPTVITLVLLVVLGLSVLWGWHVLSEPDPLSLGTSIVVAPPLGGTSAGTVGVGGADSRRRTGPGDPEIGLAGDGDVQASPLTPPRTLLVLATDPHGVPPRRAALLRVVAGEPTLVGGLIEGAGRFEVGALFGASSEVVLLVEAPGFCPAFVRVQRDRARLDLTLQPEVPLVVRVLDDGGSPVPGAEVGLLADVDEAAMTYWIWKGRSDDAGLAQVGGASRVGAWLAVEAPSYLLHHAPLPEDWPVDEPLDVVLEPGRLLEVLVQDGSGRALPRADVEIRDFATGTLRRRTADEDGLVRYHGVPAGDRSYRVTARADGHAPTEVAVLFPRTEPEHMVVVTLARSARLVVDVDLGGLDQAHVLRVSAPDVMMGVLEQLTLTDSGDVALDSLPPGPELHVELLLDGTVVAAARGLVLSNAGERRIRLAAPPLVPVTVVVTDADGLPARGRGLLRGRGAALVHDVVVPGGMLREPIVHYFELGQQPLFVQPGAYTAVIAPSEGPAVQRDVEVSGPTELVFALQDGAALVGSLVDGGGEPIAHRDLELSGWGPRGRATTDEVGHFRFAHVDPAGRAARVLLEEGDVGRVVIADGLRSADGPLELVYRRLPVTGRVVDHASLVGLATEVQLVRRGAYPVAARAASLSSATDGAFGMTLPEGSWLVTVQGPELWGHEPFDVHGDGEVWVELRVYSGARLRVDLPSLPVAGLRLEVSSTTGMRPWSHSFALSAAPEPQLLSPAVPAGVARFELWSGDECLTRFDVEVPGSDELDVDLLGALDR